MGILPDSQEVPIKVIVNRDKLRIISHISTLLSPIPIAILIIIIIGDVNGISLSQKAKDEEGSSITLLAIKIANTIGMVRGRRNCWVSASSSTAAPIAAINPLY